MLKEAESSRAVTTKSRYYCGFAAKVLYFKESADPERVRIKYLGGRHV